jgi:class 3 adenylate cyclase
MSIRLKIVLIVVPLLVATLALTGVSSYFSASHGITRLARDFLGFKAQELQAQAESQWRLLVDNNLSGKPEMVAATQAAVEGYARGLIRSPTELILAVGADGVVAMSTGAVSYQGGEQAALAALARARSTELLALSVGGASRVGKGFWFEPFGWYVVASEERAAFYDQVNQIAVRTGIILAGSILAGVVLVLVFARYLTRPLTRVVDTMKDIISTNDLSERVVVEYHDEIGQLAQTFNIMVKGLSDAYAQIRRFAQEAVVGELREKRLRTLFGRFVPGNVIEEYFANPEATLVGDNRVLAVLFSDIRGFTSISEKMRSPADLVHSLNRYFERMVAVIHEHGGTVEKYIGDAIKAFFGAGADQERGRKVPLQVLQAAMEMTQRLADFNREQEAAGRPEFDNGVGISYGVVTIGNIGGERKKEYSVIGETVDFAERLEGLTKIYRHPVIFSESLHRSVKDEIPCRLLDAVPALGGAPTRIYTARPTLEPRQKEAWGIHNLGMAEYFDRSFARAAAYFADVLKMLPGDEPATLLKERSERFLREPPADGWNGLDVARAS